jgi:hypothetical protein
LPGSRASELTLTFRCARELEGLAPPPIPAQRGLPAWLKTMPPSAYSDFLGAEFDTVKRCPPFVDAMGCGFLIPLMCDVRVENGEFSWDNELPVVSSVPSQRSPIGFHDCSQVAGSPLFEAERSLIKFHNLWTIEAPEGYSLLFMHPISHFDLPFRTLTGLVESDRYQDAWVHFPALWCDENFSGVLPRGTPIAQCIPVRRETWAARIGTLDEDRVERVHDLLGDIAREKGVYRRHGRA